MHVLLVRFSSIGDIVLQTPVASWIKKEFPNAKISFLTANEFTCILEGHPHIDEVIGMERFKGKGQLKKLFSFSREFIQNNKVDLIIDLHSNTRSRLLGIFNPSVKLLRIDKRKFERSFFVKTKINILKNTPSIHWRNILDISKFMDKNVDIHEFESFMRNINSNLSATSLAQADSLLPHTQRKKIIIGANASFDQKRWPVDKYKLLIELIFSSEKLKDYCVIVLGGKADTYLLPLKDLENNFPNRFEYLQGKTTLSETIDYIKSSSLCVGNDTGLGHIAEAFGIASVVLFGPTHPSFGFGVHIRGSQNIHTNEHCSPCSTLGNKPCKYKVQHCMENILVDRVFAEVTRVCGN